MGSGVPAFKVALLARLESDPLLIGEDLLVCLGNPHPKKPTRELVAIGSAVRESLVLSGGMERGQENYNLLVLVSVVRSSRLPLAELEARAYELADAVTSSVLAWKATGYDGHALLVMPGESPDDENLEGDVRESSVTLSFDVTGIVSYGT